MKKIIEGIEDVLIELLLLQMDGVNCKDAYDELCDVLGLAEELEKK